MLIASNVEKAFVLTQYPLCLKAFNVIYYTCTTKIFRINKNRNKYSKSDKITYKNIIANFTSW